MWFFRRTTAGFFCAKCFATGRLPVVEGDAHCPRCGEWVWTVRRISQPLDRTKPITPDYRLPIQAHHPPMSMRGRWLARLCVRHFPGHVGRWLARREERANAHISDLFSRLKTCQSRKEYEAVLGTPVHTISGKGCGTLGAGGSVLAEPDLIEHYECGDCSMDLSFKDDRIHERIGYVRPTPLHVEFRLQESGR